jgi:hypothetical protein
MDFWVRHLLFLLPLGAIAFAPTVWVQLVVARRIDNGAYGAPGLDLRVLPAFLNLLAPFFLQAFLTGAVADYLAGRPVHVGASVWRGVRALPRLLGLVLLLGFVSLCAGIAARLPFQLAGLPITHPPSTPLEMVAMLITSAWAFCLFGLSPNAVVAEGSGPYSALERSAALTKGNRWRLVALVAALLALRRAMSWYEGRLLPSPTSLEEYQRLLPVGVALFALFCLYAVTCVAVSYDDLRRIREVDASKGAPPPPTAPAAPETPPA